MTRKSVKFSSGLRRGPWKTNLTKRESNKNVLSSIFIGASNAERWSNLKAKFRFKSDSELVDYLLTLGENQPKPSSTPDHESDDGWCPPNRNGRKKRGPSLRAVLRRSNRKAGSKSDFVSDPIESEEFQSEDSDQSEDDTPRSRKLSENCPGKAKYNDVSNALPKKGLHSQSESTRVLNSDEEKEAKAHQLDAELALIVESVDLKPHKDNENEMYEFKDDTQEESHLSSGSPTVSCNNTSKVVHKRWKSYHKDKRKWKQSYAAVVPDEEEIMKPKQKDEESTGSEKERRIFKALKKNRILTAYLDSQNKIADSISKDSSHSRGEDEKVSVKEQEEKPELELSQPGNKKVADTDNGDSEDSKSKEDVSEIPIFEKSDVSSGKENQSKAATSSEPAAVEVGERVKLKKRKKKLLQDSEEPSTNLKDDNKNLCDSNTTDLEKHSKQKRNWKKSLINYELEEQESELKKKKTDISSSSSVSNIPSDAVKESQTVMSPNTSEIKSEEKIKKEKENHNECPRLVVQENESSDQDNDSALGSQCSQCHLRHVQQPCPVLNPLNVVEDSISFEQWQLQCQVQIRCSVIESPRSKSGRLRKSAPGSPITSEIEKKNKDAEHTKTTENAHVYAEESLPYALGLRVINEEHGKSVVSRSSIAQFTQFGPLVGPRVHEKDISEESDMKHIWEVLNEKHAIYLNTEDPQKSNWLRFIRPAPERHERNITLTVKQKQLYFISIVEIPEGGELLYWADDHITSWSKKKNLKSSCGGCNMRFAHPLYYRTHCAVFHDPFHSLTIRKYHCKVCGEAVMGKENIMKHAADLHDGRGAYQCQYCHKFFLRLNYLEMHRTYGCSSNPHRTRPLCDFCGRYFCQPQKLKVHIKRMHSDMSEVLKEFQCKSCLKILGSRAALQRHFKEVHHRDVVVASSCDRCGKSFQNRSNLKIHMLTHSGVKPFRCQQEGCSAAFTTKQCLQFHYKKAHGLSENALPRIERSIAYTFDAYAGETADGNTASNKDQLKKPPKLLRKNRKSSAKPQKNRSQEVQPEESDNQHEVVEPVVPLEPIILEATKCSEPDLVNHVVEPHPYTTVANSIQLPDSSISHPEVTERRPLTPGELIISMPYEEEERQLVGSKVLTPLRTVTHLQHNTDGHKKWLGEVIEVAEEAAAAAMRLSPRLSPHLKRDIYDFDENKVKSKLQYLDNPVRQELQMDVGLGRSKTSTALAPFHHPESASMLVEAALDAAERDICCPSLSTKMPMSRSPEPLHLLQPSYCDRSPHEEGPPTLPPNAAFYNADPGDYSASYSSHLHPLDSYSIPSSHMNAPARLYSTQSHQMHQHHALPSGPMSSDDEGAVESDCNSRGECAQNLSLSGKDKLYSVPSQHPEMAARSSDYQDHMSIPQQNNLNFSGTVVVSPPRYHLYDLSPDRQRSDTSVADLSVMSSHRGLPQDYSSYEDMGGSMDLSVPRVHGHGHTPPPSYSTGHAQGHAHQYTASDCIPDCVPAYSSHSHPHTHPPPYQDEPLQRPHVSSSSTSPSASPSPGPAHYHSYPQYY